VAAADRHGAPRRRVLTWALTWPWWTESTVRYGPNRYQLIWTVHANPAVPGESKAVGHRGRRVCRRRHGRRELESPVWLSRAPNRERRARARSAHRESVGEDLGVRGGSRGAVDDGGALEREMHAGEFESRVFVTKVTRQGYLRLRERTAELRVASVTSFEARVWENRGGGGSRLRAENGDRGGALLGVI